MRPALRASRARSRRRSRSRSPGDSRRRTASRAIETSRASRASWCTNCPPRTGSTSRPRARGLDRRGPGAPALVLRPPVNGESMNLQSLSLRHAMREFPVCFAAVEALPAGEFLGEDEKLQVAGFQFPAKKESFLLGRFAAKCALGAMLAEPDLRQIAIRAGIYGQPLIEHPRA